MPSLICESHLMQIPLTNNTRAQYDVLRQHAVVPYDSMTALVHVYHTCEGAMANVRELARNSTTHSCTSPGVDKN
eukprot:5709433-Pleurochrysis_carterae.AAC.4